MGKVQHLKDYKPNPFNIDKAFLDFTLNKEKTTVESTLDVHKKEKQCNKPLFLHGTDLELESIHVLTKEGTERALKEGSDFEKTNEGITITTELPESFKLKIKNAITPEANKTCMGIYHSHGLLTSQCEAEGFRQITYFIDQPDNLAEFTTRMTGSKKDFPTLLSNGNEIARKDVGSDKHSVTFHDPFKKPSYLFALVAGPLACLSKTFQSISGKLVKLQIFTEERFVDKCQHALKSLHDALAWHEKAYGLPYDLDVYRIVGVRDFNMGAMENKGLNIFNLNYLLSESTHSTDLEHANVISVIAHELMHNWAGNRTPVKTWFELSLKEGLATHLEREFTRFALGSNVPRINDIRTLRTFQFPEDQGPNSHAVRPSSYENIDNFYTTTIYEKGAEVLQTLRTLIGEDAWHKGLYNYHTKFDGRSAVIEDFIQEMETTSGKDLKQFLNWYTQAGTPQLNITEKYDEKAKTYSLTIKQFTPQRLGEAPKSDLLIPIKIGLLSQNGQALNMTVEGKELGCETVLELNQAEQTFVFEGVTEKPIPSVLRGFSAPVQINTSPLSQKDQIFLMVHDKDDFNRWDASQTLAENIIFDLCSKIEKDAELRVPMDYALAIRKILQDRSLEPGLKAEMLALPSPKKLLAKMEVADPVRLEKAMEFFKDALAKFNNKEYLDTYRDCLREETPNFSSKNMYIRNLKNQCLGPLSRLQKYRVNKEVESCVLRDATQTQNMDNRFNALSAFISTPYANEKMDKLKAQHLENFYHEYKNYPPLVEKWLRLQALNPQGNAVERLKQLEKHEGFNIENPNCVRSLLRTFAGLNVYQFHHESGRGYEYIADKIIQIDKFNPSGSADLARYMTLWSNLDPKRAKLLNDEFVRISEAEGISSGVMEHINKGIAAYQATHGVRFPLDLELEKSVTLQFNKEAMAKDSNPQLKDEFQNDNSKSRLNA